MLVFSLAVVAAKYDVTLLGPCAPIATDERMFASMMPHQNGEAQINVQGLDADHVKSDLLMDLLPHHLKERKLKLTKSLPQTKFRLPQSRRQQWQRGSALCQRISTDRSLLKPLMKILLRDCAYQLIILPSRWYWHVNPILNLGELNISLESSRSKISLFYGLRWDTL